MYVSLKYFLAQKTYHQNVNKYWHKRKKKNPVEIRNKGTSFMRKELSQPYDRRNQRLVLCSLNCNFFLSCVVSWAVRRVAFETKTKEVLSFGAELYFFFFVLEVRSDINNSFVCSSLLCMCFWKNIYILFLFLYSSPFQLCNESFPYSLKIAIKFNLCHISLKMQNWCCLCSFSDLSIQI